MDKNVDDQADSSSIRSRGSIHSTTSGEHKGLPMPRLQSFSSGQVFNSSTGMQILVIPSKDDHVLEVSVTWQLSVNKLQKQRPLKTGCECTLKDCDLLTLHCNILTLTRPMASQHLLAMEASDNLNVQWSLCPLVYIATSVCLCTKIFFFSPFDHILLIKMLAAIGPLFM